MRSFYALHVSIHNNKWQNGNSVGVFFFLSEQQSVSKEVLSSWRAYKACG